MIGNRPTSAGYGPTAVKAQPEGRTHDASSPAARTPGADSWNIESFAPDPQRPQTVRTPMRGRKGRSPPPTWLVNAVAPAKHDSGNMNIKGHIQSLAKLDKEELAEKLFHAKVAISELQSSHMLAKVENRKLEASLARQVSPSQAWTGALSTTAAGTRVSASTSPGRGRKSVSDIVRNLKSKNKQLRGERDQALRMVAHMQRASRIARLHELEAQVTVLKDEVANQMALRKGASEELRRTVASQGVPQSLRPPSNSGLGSNLRPGTASAESNGKRRLADVLQELHVASRTLQTEAQRLRDACEFVSNEEFASGPRYRAASKVFDCLVDHAKGISDTLSHMPSNHLASALGALGLVSKQEAPASPYGINSESETSLAATLSSLAAPLARTVARHEAVSGAEYEKDAVLRGATENLAYLADQYLENYVRLNPKAMLSVVASKHISPQHVGNIQIPPSVVAHDNVHEEDDTTKADFTPGDTREEQDVKVDDMSGDMVESLEQSLEQEKVSSEAPQPSVPVKPGPEDCTVFMDAQLSRGPTAESPADELKESKHMEGTSEVPAHDPVEESKPSEGVGETFDGVQQNGSLSYPRASLQSNPLKQDFAPVDHADKPLEMKNSGMESSASYDQSSESNAPLENAQSMSYADSSERCDSGHVTVDHTEPELKGNESGEAGPLQETNTITDESKPTTSVGHAPSVPTVLEDKSLVPEAEEQHDASCILSATSNATGGASAPSVGSLSLDVSLPVASSELQSAPVECVTSIPESGTPRNQETEKTTLRQVDPCLPGPLDSNISSLTRAVDSVASALVGACASSSAERFLAEHSLQPSVGAITVASKEAVPQQALHKLEEAVEPIDISPTEVNTLAIDSVKHADLPEVPTVDIASAKQDNLPEILSDKQGSAAQQLDCTQEDREGVESPMKSSSEVPGAVVQTGSTEKAEKSESSAVDIPVKSQVSSIGKEASSKENTEVGIGAELATIIGGEESALLAVLGGSVPQDRRETQETDISWAADELMYTLVDELANTASAGADLENTTSSELFRSLAEK